MNFSSKTGEAGTAFTKEISECTDAKRLGECMDAKALSDVTDAEILRTTERLASDVRRINAEFLRYLREVEGRRLYLALGYPSLYEYCVRALKLSEGSASRRIGAMRLIRDLPEQGGGEVLQAVEEGRVNLSTLATLQRFVNQEAKVLGEPRRYSPEQKQALVREMEGRSQVECEVRLAEISPQSVPSREKERVLTPVLTEVKFVMTEELKQKLERIRELDSHHGNPHPTYAELFLRMADRVLKQIDPKRPRHGRKPAAAKPDSLCRKTPAFPGTSPHPVIQSNAVARINPIVSEVHAATAAPMASAQQWSSLVQRTVARAQAQAQTQIQAQASAPASSSGSGSGSSSSLDAIPIFIHSDFLKSPHPQGIGSLKPSRAIPAALRRAVWRRDGGACTFIIPPKKGDTGIRMQCGSRFQIELDHIIPFGKGGPSTLKNLRCVCRAHNTWLAVQAYGAEKMEAFQAHHEKGRPPQWRSA